MGLYFWGAFLITFLISYLVSGKKPGARGLFGYIVFDIYKYRIHLHHWFLGSILLLVFYVTNNLTPLLAGALCGIIFQGLTYPDFYKIIYKKN